MRNRLLALMALAGLATCAIPGGAQNANLPNSTTSSLNALNAVAVGPPTSNGGTCMADVSGTWSGTLTFQIKGQGNNPVAAQAYTFAGGVQGTTTATNGSYYWPASGTMLCQATMTGFTSGPAIVTISTSAGAAALPPGIISSLPPVTLVTPVTVNCGATPCSVTTPAPATTISPGLFVGVTNACPSTAPANINGAYTCTNDSTGRLQVSTPVPFATTTPFGTPILAQAYTGTSNALVPTAPIFCNNATTFGTSSNGAIQIANSVTGDVIYVCGIVANFAGGSQQQIADSSSSNCGGLTTIAVFGTGQWTIPPTNWLGIKVAATHALCVNTTGATSSFIGTIFWTQASPGP